MARREWADDAPGARRTCIANVGVQARSQPKSNQCGFDGMAAAGLGACSAGGSVAVNPPLLQPGGTWACAPRATRQNAITRTRTDAARNMMSSDVGRLAGDQPFQRRRTCHHLHLCAMARRPTAGNAFAERWAPGASAAVEPGSPTSAKRTTCVQRDLLKSTG